MSAYQRVKDYMGTAPDAANHIALWEKAHMDKLRERVDALDLEKRSLSPAESDFLASFECQPKFTRRNMVDGITIGAIVDARTSKGDKLPRTENYEINFRGGEAWELSYAVANVDYVTRDPAFYTMDRRMQGGILRQCPGLSAGQMNELRVDAAKDALALPTDMRHMFTKMALMLFDYTLAAASCIEEMDIAEDLTDFTYTQVGADARLAFMAQERIVVDSEGMSPVELGLLQFAAQEYPAVKYAGDNIYTNCSMAADSLAIISERDIDIDTSGMWGSPDTLYQTMWSLAVKLGATKCLIEALTGIRGKCKHMADVTSRIGPVSIYSGLPLSMSKQRGMGAHAADPVLTTTPGYYSTTVALIADYMYGSMFELSATFVVEELGGLGNKVCGDSPKHHACYNGLLRDAGIRHEDGSINVLLRNWCSLTGAPITWGYGGKLKDYILELTELLRGGHWECPIPQLTTLIPYTSTPNTTWGYSRAYTGKSDIFKADDQERGAEQLAICAWIMGQRQVRPRVGYNKEARRTRFTTAAESKLAAEAGASLVLGQVRMWVSDSVGGREDEYEASAGALFKSSFRNVKCQLLYDKREASWKMQPAERDYDVMITTTLGKKAERPAPDNKTTLSLQPVTTGPAPTVRDPFAAMKAMTAKQPIRPNRAPKADIGPSGVPRVGPYILAGDQRHELLKMRRSGPAKGDSFRASVIDVPGDGRCGLHAVVEDLKAHGLLSTRDGALTLQYLDRETDAPTFHSPEDIAGAVLKMDLGLDVIADGVVHSYGESGVHRVLMEYRDHHYRPLVEDDGGEEYQVNEVIQYGKDNAELIQRLGEFAKMIAPPKKL